jgi:hypothetical protein
MTSAKCPYCRCIVAVTFPGVYAPHMFRGSTCAGSRTTVPDEARP